MKKEKYWKSVPIKCGATRKTSINCSVYHESVNVDANMDRCMRYKMNLYGIYIYMYASIRALDPNRVQVKRTSLMYKI